MPYPLALLPAFADVNRFWYLIPLAAAVSLAYTASRYELPEVILRRSAGFFLKTLGFMAAIFAVLFVLSVGL